MTTQTPTTNLGILIRQRRQAMTMSIDHLAARLGPLASKDMPTTGILPADIRQLEEQPHLVHLGGYASLRIAAALELSPGQPSPLLEALLRNTAWSLHHGYLSVRAACHVLECTEEDLQDAFHNNDINYVLYN